MEKGVFRFKQFSCQHYGSSMRIGVDAVLLGAWAQVEGRRILDVGTGCGVIALMCAQRNSEALIDAVETDMPSVSEAQANFKASPWYERLNIVHENYLSFIPAYYYDNIVSNPPYFSSGVDATTSVRMHARHEGDLSPITLLSHARNLLVPGGRVSMVVPYLRVNEIVMAAETTGFYSSRRLDVRGNVSAPFKRTLVEFRQFETPCVTESLTLETAPNVPTEEYRRLCGEFYLNF